MQPAAAYIASDRRQLMAVGQTVPEETTGATLFADISGFTPLTSALVRVYGPRRGADELTRHLNIVYTALISEVERYGGSVIGFSGDAITCWFTALASAALAPETTTPAISAAILGASTAALAMQQVMQALQVIRLHDGTTVTLAIKTAVAAGPARRFAVGDPTIQLIDVLAGATLDRMAATEQMAQQGELLLDAPTAASILDVATVAAWRTHRATGEQFAVVTALQHTAPPIEPRPETALPESIASAWVLPAVYARLQNEGGRFLAELRPAAALFLKFTGLDYDRDPESAAKLDRYIGWVQGVINRYEGALIQLTTGDKGSYLYAAFGAPIAHDDDIRRAVMAALELRTPPAHFPFITSTQIGISQGAMRVGAYGSATRRTYGVLGDETVVAARLMTHAAAGQVVVSQIVADALEHEFQFQALGEFQLKGKPAPQPLYALLQPIAHSRPLLDLYPTPLVGRAAELATVCAQLNTVQQGQGRLVRIEGSAGVGKSHLVAAVARQAQAQGFTVITGACQSTSQDTAYAAIRLAMRALLGLDAVEALAVPTSASLFDAQIAYVTATISAINPAWILRLPLLRDLLALPIPDNATTAAFDARLRYEALISLVVDLVQSYAQRQPLLLLFEDIHWMDEASQGVALALARILHTVPFLLLLVQRPPVREYDPFLDEIATLAPQTHLLLEELTPAGIAELVQQRLDRVTAAIPISPLALSLIQAQTQGNPFFAEELIDAMLDSAHLQQQDDSWHLSSAITQRLRNSGCLTRVDGKEVVATDAPLSTVDLGMPSTIQGVILARLDRLPEPVKLTLKVASVIGRVFEHDLLMHAHPVQRADALLIQQLETLLQRDFARLENPEPRRTYLFKHNITQEVVYQTLLTDQRQELHLAIAQTLEGLQPDNVEDLAHHFYNSDLLQQEVRGKALHYLDAAGLRSKHDYANETALSYFNRALEVEERPAWLKAKVEVLHILGRREEEVSTLNSLAQQSATPQFDLALLWGEYYEAMSDYAQGEAAIRQALALAQTTTEQEGQARCLARLGMLAWRQGEYEAAENLYGAALPMVQGEVNSLSVEAEIRYGLGLVYRQQGKFDKARAAFERDLALNQQLSNLQSEARALNALGGIEHLQKNFQEAILYYQQALTIREQIGDRAGVGASLLNIAQNFSALGSYHEAEPMLREALQIQKLLNNQWWQAITLNELGILQFTIGNLIEARHNLEQGLALSQEGIQAYLLCNLGQVLRDMRELRRAEEVLREGLHLAQTQGDVHLAAITLNDLALVSLHEQNYIEANQQAQASLEKFENLQLELSTTCNLAIIAATQVALNNPLDALATVRKALQILDACDGEGPDFPQRDYWMCYEVLQMLDETRLATQALTAAHRLLMRQAERIHDPNMRRAYLEDVAFNRSILQAINEKMPVI